MSRPAVEADRPVLARLEEACMRDYAVAVRREVDHLPVDALHVVRELQNRGIGANALRLALSEAASEGLPVRLSVLGTDLALAFYLRHGLVVEGETAERRSLTSPR